MTESGAFEPTQPQFGVDDNRFTLIDPEAIPYPLTDIWWLNYAAETLRTGGENLADQAEDMRTTWLGLQAHYEAPESGALFPKMNSVASRAESSESDLRTIADALEDLAEAARAARRCLNDLRLQAQIFRRRHEDKLVWWLTKDEESDELALFENERLKGEVNAAWSTFNEAENDCATRISALFGGPVYSSPDQADRTDLVYGLPTSLEEPETSGFEETLMGPANDITEWAGTQFHPGLASFENSTTQAVWDAAVTNSLWPLAVGLVSSSGQWHPDTGWKLSPWGRVNNIKLTLRDGTLDTAALVGVHDEHGWLWETPQNGQGQGSTLDRWLENLENTRDDLWESYTGWSKREEDPAYSNATIATNVVLMTGGLPLKIIKGFLAPGTGGSVSTPTPPDESFSGPGGPNSGRGPSPNAWPTSPLPQDRPGSGAPITRRFSDQLTQLRNSLLDPHQHRGNPSPPPDRPSSGPDRPTSTDRGDRPTPDPTTPHRGNSPTQDNGPSPTRPRDGGPQRGNGQENHSGTRPDRGSEAPTSSPRWDSNPQNGSSGDSRSDQSSEQRPQGHREDNSSGDWNNNHTGRDDAQRNGTRPGEDQRQPEPATGGGRGDDGGNQPPRDRTATGDDGNRRDNENNSNNQDSSSSSDPELKKKLEKADELEESLRKAGLTEEEITRLRGDNPRDGDEWQRAAGAISQGFNKKISPLLHPEATRFALDGAANPREFAYRYEYYKATFDEFSDTFRDQGFGKNQSKQQAAQQILDTDVHTRLEADHAIVNEMRGGEPARVDPDLPPGALEQAVREQAGNIEFGHETASAYHGRKHYKGIPPMEKTGNPVRDYLNSVEHTIRHGEISNRTTLDNGSERLTITRPKLDKNGNHATEKDKKLYMRAFVIIKKDGSLVIPTYGSIEANA